MHTQRADQYSTQLHLYRSFRANMQGKVPHGARWKQHRQKNKKKRLKNAIRTNRGWNNNSNNENQRNAENAVWAFSLIKNILRDLNIQPSLTANSLIDPPEEEESQFNRETFSCIIKQAGFVTDWSSQRIFPRWWGNTDTKRRNSDTTLDLQCGLLRQRVFMFRSHKGRQKKGTNLYADGAVFM